MTIFRNCTVVLDLKDLPFKERRKAHQAITDNGGRRSYVVNKQCSFIVVSNLGNMSINHQQSALKHQVPVVGLEYLQACLEKKTLLPASEHVLVPVKTPPRPASTSKSVLVRRQLITEKKHEGSDPSQRAKVENQVKNDTYVYNHRIYSERDRDLPTFPSHFQVAKYSIYNTVVGGCWSVLELQSAVGEEDRVFRVVRYIKKTVLERDQLVFCSCSEDALQVFQQLQDRLRSDNFQLHQVLPSRHEDMASPSLKQLLLEEKLNCSTLSQEVGVFVELVWTEALGSLTKVLKVPALSISPNDVSRAEGLLLQVRRSEEESERKTLLEALHSVLPHTLPDSLPPAKLTSQLLDLCQVLRDTLCVHEAVMRSSSPSSLGKYRALGCSIERLPPQSPDYHTVIQLLQKDKHRVIQIHQVFSVRRGVELQIFREELGNIKPLLHSTSPASCVGILSRGLLLPRVGVEHHGVQRTDVGFLGGGIYFSDSFSASVKYSKRGVTDGSRLLLVCDVALGHCREFRKKDTTLTSAPEGYNSVRGVRSTLRQHSEFKDDEYVVFSPEQVRLKYVVQYSLPDEQLKDFQPHVDTSVENIPLAETSDIYASLVASEDSGEFDEVKNPLDSVTAGLLDSAGKTLPLQAVHVKCRLVDLLSQVIIFQTYSNPNPAPIEAKYVFPLEESAAVCGFEAFINGKRVIGQVKEKKQARREYKQAIAKGHGAYLMDQEAPDVFTISVGNLPPDATVLIKITFISELLVKDDSIFFQLPGIVAPWQQSAALNERTQSTVKKVRVTELNGEFSLSLSIEMPYEITSLRCSTHRIQTKRTNCKAVVSTLPRETLGSDGFQLYIRLSEMHMPRMWVENHPDKDSQACMLVFYPDFSTLHEASEEPSPASGGVQEVLLLLDSSESMRGKALLNARHIALHLLSKLDKNLNINIMLFGTDYKAAFTFTNVLTNVFDPAKKFIKFSPPVGGSTELWRPLRSLSLLPPSQGTRSLVLLSDGHVQNPALTLQLVRNNAAHTRLFTCGLSKTANKHMLRALAQAGGGAYEFFDTKTRHNWSDKVASQVKRLTSPGCSSVAVKWQLFNPTAPPPVQAPAQLNALFSNCHTLVYGFVPHCTQASLYGDLCGKEIKTMVSTTDLQKTKGTFLHKLTARAVIRDYEDGILHMDEAEHEGKKAQMKSYIIELSKEFSVLSQFTSFVAIEKRDARKAGEGFTDIPRLIAEEDVDLLPYMDWEEEKDSLDDYLSSEEEIFANVVYDCQDDVSDMKRTSVAVDNELLISKEDIYVNVGAECRGDLLSVRGHMKRTSAMEQAKSPLKEEEEEEPDYESVCCDESEIYESLPQDLDPSPVFQGFPPPQQNGDDLLAAHGHMKRTSLTEQSESLVKEEVEEDSDHEESWSSGSAPYGDPDDMSPYPVPERRKSRFFKSESHAETLESEHGSPKCGDDLLAAHGHMKRTSVTEQAKSPLKEEEEEEPDYESVSCDESEIYESTESLGLVPPSVRSPPAVQRDPPPQKAPKFTMSYGGGGPPPRVCPLPPHIVALVSQSGRGAVDPVLSLHTRIRMAHRHEIRSSATESSKAESLLDVTSPAQPCASWEQLACLQSPEGYWECTEQVGKLLHVDLSFFANVFLKEKGISSLGPKAHADILRLVSTLLVLQLVRVRKLVQGELLQSLFRLRDPPQHSSSSEWEALKRAVDWVCWADRQYPCVCSRLEFGRDWESSTRQLLGFDHPHPHTPSPLSNLCRTVTE